MRILFDTSAFGHMVQRAELAPSIDKLRQLIQVRALEIVGGCTMLQELAGMSAGDPEGYRRTITIYREVTQGRILRITNELVDTEARTLLPVDYENSLLDQAKVTNLFVNLTDPRNAAATFAETKASKAGYAERMENAQAATLAAPGIDGLKDHSIVNGYRNWFDRFDDIMQDWFVHMFHPVHEVQVRSLPHVSAFLGYALTRIYERNVLNKKNRDNDVFDQSHFTDASVVDKFITDDEALKRTASAVRNRNFEVVRLDEFLCSIG